MNIRKNIKKYVREHASDLNIIDTNDMVQAFCENGLTDDEVFHLEANINKYLEVREQSVTDSNSDSKVANEYIDDQDYNDSDEGQEFFGQVWGLVETIIEEEYEKYLNEFGSEVNNKIIHLKLFADEIRFKRDKDLYNCNVEEVLENILDKPLLRSFDHSFLQLENNSELSLPKEYKDIKYIQYNEDEEIEPADFEFFKDVIIDYITHEIKNIKESDNLVVSDYSR